MISQGESNPGRKEHDSFGEIEVPAGALWGAQTERASRNFQQIGGGPLPREFIAAVALIKAAAARANARLGLLPADVAGAIDAAANDIAGGKHQDQFPVDVYQTGSGTSTNMNVNEVIASLAGRALGRPVHPNDHVNMCQSSNDVIPSAIHLGALRQCAKLYPALERLRTVLLQKETEWAGVLKTGRTHLMDAMPMTLGQEASGWRAQIDNAIARLKASEPRLLALAQGGTAIGTGINAHEKFAVTVIEELRTATKLPLTLAPNYFAAMGSQDAAVEFSGQLRTLAVALMKICNDLRWMNSGPLAGLGEIKLPALQPGSSIMPGKVNPVVPEAVAMVAAQVMGFDAAIAIAGQSGNFQLNVMLPLIASNLLESIRLLTNGAAALADQCVVGAQANVARLDEALARNPILVTALNPVIGYERAAAIAKRAYAEGRAVFDVALEMSGLKEDELRRLLDPAALTRGGLHGGGGQG
ncbi:MAG TPA: class II fumarate hydratase [Steroidobacteraceae bacterium]|nr:class II fumarate hydratase [Steroidobacteraceae bacterium]